MADVQNSPLAEPSDVETMLRRPLTPAENNAAVDLLSQASAKMRTACGRPFGWAGGTDTATLKVTGGQVFLPEPPTEVISVIDEDGSTVTGWRLDGQWLKVPGMSSSRFVTVTWTHQQDIPDDVRGAVAGMVARVLAADPRAIAGMSQQTDSAGSVQQTQTFATWAQGGQILLAPDDYRVAAAHKPWTPRLWVMRA